MGSEGWVGGGWVGGNSGWDAVGWWWVVFLFFCFGGCDLMVDLAMSGCGLI